MTALMCEQPEDPVEFLESCLALVRTTNMTDYDWTTFNRLIVKKEERKMARQEFATTKPLPPIGNGQQSEAEVESSTHDQNDSAMKGHGRIDIGDKPVVFVLGKAKHSWLCILFPVYD